MTGYFSRLLAYTGVTAGTAGNDALAEGSARFQADDGLPASMGDALSIVDAETFVAPASEMPAAGSAIRRTAAGLPDDRLSPSVPELEARTPVRRSIAHTLQAAPDEVDRNPVREDGRPPSGEERRPCGTNATRQPETEEAEDSQAADHIVYLRKQDERDRETAVIVPVRRPGPAPARVVKEFPAPERPAVEPAARIPDRAGSTPGKIRPAATDRPAGLSVGEKTASKKAEPAIEADETEDRPGTGRYRMKDVLEWVASGTPVEVPDERTAALPHPASAPGREENRRGMVTAVGGDGPAQPGVTDSEVERDADIRERDLRLSIGTISVTVEGPREEKAPPVARARHRKAVTDESSRVSRQYIRMR